MAIKELVKGLPKISLAWKNPALFISFPKQLKFPEIQPLTPQKLSNQDKKVSFIVVDADGALTRSSSFMKTCHNMNIIVQTKREDSYSLNGKGEDQIKHRII